MNKVNAFAPRSRSRSPTKQNKLMEMIVKIQFIRDQSMILSKDTVEGRYRENFAQNFINILKKKIYWKWFEILWMRLNKR